MSMTVKDIKDWLDTLGPEDSVGVDWGGLCLQCEEHPEAYLEIGGLPEDTPEPWETIRPADGPPYDAATATGMYDRDF